MTLLTIKFFPYGIRGKPYNLLTSYLTNKKQCTIVNKVKLNWCDSTYGAPQGSTLGPLLFQMYINDLLQVLHLKITLFADDAVLTYTDGNPVTLQNKINDELQKIKNWMQANKLTINYNKTNYMIIY